MVLKFSAVSFSSHMWLTPIRYQRKHHGKGVMNVLNVLKNVHAVMPENHELHLNSGSSSD